MDDLLREFLTDTTAEFARLEPALTKLRQTAGQVRDGDLIVGLLRTARTMNATCRFLGLTQLAMLARATETVLAGAADGNLAMTPEVVSLILEAVDGIKVRLSVLERTEAEPDGADADLVGRLHALAEAERRPLPAAVRSRS